MKTAWAELDGRIGRQEMFSDRFVRETLEEKSQRSANRLLKYEMTGTILLALVLLVLLWFRYMMPPLLNARQLDIFVAIFLIYCAVVMVWQIVKMIPLFGFDMSAGVRDNIKKITKYGIYVRFEKNSAYILNPLIVVFCIVMLVTLKVSAWMWVNVGFWMLVGTLYCVYYYKKIYMKNMNIIRKSLAELKDLDDHEE